MIIEIIENFKIIPEENGNVLLIESDKLDECIQFAIDNNITKISIQGYYGYKLSNLDFLKKNNFFTQLSVVEDMTDINISAVHYLKGLTYLSLSNNKQNLDLSSFPELEKLSLDWNNNLTNLNKCKKLKHLALWKFKPKSKSFIELDGLNGLESLKITQSNIESFSGIQNLHQLNQLEGYYLSKLESLKGIELLAKSLKILILENCRKLIKYESVFEDLVVLEKLILGDCGELDNLKFINKMDKISFFSFVNTNIKDGNLFPLKEKHFEYVGFNDKKHYSHKMKEITPSFSWDKR